MYIDKQDFVGGDGGPMVVLQSHAVAKWQGAGATKEEFENSLIMGGYIETDYDVICGTKERVIFRYERDMLVLEDSEWGAFIFVDEFGQIVVAQLFSGDLFEHLEQIKQMEPSNSHSFDVKDTHLRLLVGAENGKGEIYGFKDVPIAPGKKQCNIYSDAEFLIVTIA